MFLVHAAVRRFDEPETVDDAKGGQGANQADVRTFRRFNGAHTAVMGVVDVTDFVAGALPGQTARSQGRQAALVRQFGQGIVLVHELRQLAAAKKFLDGRHHGADIDQGLRRNAIHILDGHTFPDDAFHPGQADAELVLQQFADAADATVAQMVDVILFAVAVHNVQQVAEGGQDVFLRDGAQLFIDTGRENDAQDFAVQLADLHLVDAFGGVNAAFLHLVQDILRQEGSLFDDDFARFRIHEGLVEDAVRQAVAPAQLFIQFVPAHIGQIVTTVVEKGLADELLGRFHRRRFPGTQLFIEFDDGFVAVRRRILFQGRLDGFHRNDAVVRMGFDLRIAEEVQDFFIRFQPHGAQQHRGRHLAGTVHTGVDDMVEVRFVFNPGAAVRDHRRPVQVNGAGIHLLVIVHAGRTNQLAYNDTFRPVDHKGARRRHEGKIAHKNGGFLDFSRILVEQADLHIQRSAVGSIPFLAFLDGVFRLAELEAFEGKLQIAVKILNGGNIVEDFVQAFVDEPFVGFALQINQMGHRDDFVDLPEAVPCSVTCLNRFKHVTLHSL